MGDWSILRPSSNDYLASLASSYTNHDADLSQFHIMSSFIDRTFSPSSLYDENSFCTPDNIDQCISHLNQELAGLGFKPLSREGVTRTTSLINTLSDIMRLYQRSGRIKEDLENRLHRVTSDVTENQSVIRRLKQDRERLEREIAQEKEKHRQTHNKHKTLAAKIKSDKEELKRIQSVVRDRDGQYKHELKKKQREINKLMERLHQLLMDKNPDRRIGMDMVGIVQRDGKRSTWKNTVKSSKQEEMYQLLISNYEEKQQELRVENSDLRDCLVDMQRELCRILNNSEVPLSSTVIKNGNLSASSSEDDLSTTSTVSHELSEEYYQMPYDIMKENLHKNFKDTCRKIRENLRKSSNHFSGSKSSGKKPSPSKSPSSRQEERENERRSEDLEKLKKQIDKYKDIVKQQEELIQQSLHTQSKSMENSFYQESQLLQERESLSEQRRRFYQEKANFEEERRKFTESAIQFGKEKQQLEQEKASLLKSQFLQLSPFSSKPPKPKSSLKGEKTRLLPSTPVFSPAPGGKAKVRRELPTTDELYRVLGIAPKQSGKKDGHASAKRRLPKSFSNDSLISSSMSAPCVLEQHSSGPAKQLSFDDMDDSDSMLLETERRRSSTGSQNSLDGQ